MKKRINGHTYNTDTATLLAVYEHGEGWIKFNVDDNWFDKAWKHARVN